ncbi:MAG: putative membrane protein [Lachnoclostridium sp.]
MKGKKVALLLIVLGVLLVVFLIQVYSFPLFGNYINTDNKKVVIHIWTIHGDVEDALKEILDQYEETHPGITFDITVYKNEVYQIAVNNAMLTDSLPDMFFMWGYSKLKRFVDSGMALDITDLVEKNNLPAAIMENKLDAFTFDNRIYGLPLYGWTASLFCNREIFQQYGLSYPKNYNQFMEVCKELKSQGEIPVITGGKEGWLSSLYFMSLVQGEGPGNSIFQASRDPERFYDLQYINATEKLGSMIKQNIWQNDYLECDAYNASYQFSQGKGAMLYYGSWATTLLEGKTSKVKGKVDVIDFPNNENREGIGGYVDTFVINKEGVIGKDDELVQMYIDVMKAVSDKIVNEKGGGIPVYKHQVVDKSKYPLLYKCWDLNKDRTLYPAYDQIMSEELSERYYYILNEFMANEITDQEFIEQLSKPLINN